MGNVHDASANGGMSWSEYWATPRRRLERYGKALAQRVTDIERSRK